MFQRNSLLMFLCWLLAAADVRAGEAAEQDKLKGSWRFINTSRDEKKETRGGMQVIFKDDTISFLSDDGKLDVRGKCKIYPTRTPKMMDIVLDNNGVKTTTLAIYELDGDNLKLCHYLGTRAGTERPKEFLADKQTVVGILKRERK